jgi:hypothetical protein
VPYTQLSIGLFQTSSLVSSGFEVLSFTNISHCPVHVPFLITHLHQHGLLLGKYQCQNNIRNLNCVYPICVMLQPYQICRSAIAE